ncbi:MAG: hypothetical protein EBR40_10615 [Proteobacteria bacterium]|jgi:hypothetical protein|nr:hypothetical protein [Pseudomonadota bacterium]
MAFPSPSGRRGSKPSSAPKTRVSSSLNEDRLRIERDLQELRRKEAELRRLEELKKKEMAELPGKIAERQKKQREMIRERALSTATDDVFGKRRDKRHVALKASVAGRRMTLPEQRAARVQFLLLCGVLTFILILLWKSIR